MLRNKFLIALLALALVFAFTACDTGGGEPNEGPGGSGTGTGGGGGSDIGIGGGSGGGGGTYIITGGEGKFTATKNSVTIGSANQSLSMAIGYIRTDAAGANIEIQFGNGVNVLDIDTSYVVLNNTGSTSGI